MLPEKENPKSARAVAVVLTAVILPVPKRFISLAAKRLENIVPLEIITVTSVARDIGIPNSG